MKAKPEIIDYCLSLADTYLGYLSAYDFVLTDARGYHIKGGGRR